jgi:hypothetical protein
MARGLDTTSTVQAPSNLPLTIARFHFQFWEQLAVVLALPPLLYLAFQQSVSATYTHGALLKFCLPPVK